MPDEGGGESLPAEQHTAPLSSIQDKSTNSMQESNFGSVPIALDAKSDSNQKVISTEMDRIRREKQAFRTPDHRGPTPIKSDLISEKKLNTDIDKASESIEKVNETLIDGKDENHSVSTHSQNSTQPHLDDNKALSGNAVNGSTTRSINAKPTTKSSKESEQTIDFDDATLAHRMWSYLQNKQLEIDDGRRAWVNAYYGVKKQAEELERKKSALEKWRDSLVMLEDQLPEWEKKLEKDADQLYKRRKEFEEKQKDMDTKRREFYNMKQSLVDWARADDNLYDRMMDRKPPRRSKHISHHGHTHASHPLPPSHIQMVGGSGNDWGGSPISTPESHLDDYSYADGLVSIDMDVDTWGLPMGGPGKNLFGPPGAGPSGTAKKGKSKKVSGLPPPPPPPPGDGKTLSGSSTSLASSNSVLPLPEEAQEQQTQGKGKGKLVNVTFGDLTNSSTSTDASKESSADTLKGLWKKTDVTQNTATWLEKSKPLQTDGPLALESTKIDSTQEANVIPEEEKGKGKENNSSSVKSLVSG